jgi:hypothetical protein
MDPQMTDPGQRREFIDYWRALALSGADQLVTRGLVSAELVDAMQSEFSAMEGNPAATYDYSARQVQAQKLSAKG